MLSMTPNNIGYSTIVSYSVHIEDNQYINQLPIKVCLIYSIVVIVISIIHYKISKSSLSYIKYKHFYRSYSSESQIILYVYLNETLHKIQQRLYYHLKYFQILKIFKILLYMAVILKPFYMLGSLSQNNSFHTHIYYFAHNYFQMHKPSTYN